MYSVAYEKNIAVGIRILSKNASLANARTHYVLLNIVQMVDLFTIRG